MSRYSDETLAALLKSAERWKTEDPDRLGSYHNCPLCALHRKVIYDKGGNFNEYISCDGCPIRDKTGEDGCEGSPYDAFFIAEDEDDATDKARVFSKWLFALYEEVK